MLYIGMIAASREPDVALQVCPLAAKDIAQLPAEQRVRLLSALAASLVRVDTETSFGILNQLVAAYNDVRANPRRGKFDPAKVSRRNRRDSSLILPGNRGFYEAVQTQRGRHNFGLHVPGVNAFTLTAFLAAADAKDYERLSAAILGLRDETTQAAAWVTLAQLRLKK